MATPKEQYIRELNIISERFGHLEDTTVKEMLAMLRDLRAEIAVQLTGVEDFELFRLQQMQTGIEVLIAQFQRKLDDKMSAAVQQAIQDGGAFVVDPLHKLGMSGAFFRPSTAQVNAALDFSAALVRKIGDDARNQVSQQVRLSMLGKQTPFQAMHGVTRALGVEAHTGIWKKQPDPVQGVAARAETDLRTELQRAFNLSTFSQQQANAERVPGLTKGWMASAGVRTRPGHLRAHRDYQRNPIPVDEPFVVYDIADNGRVRGSAKLMYPGDPRAPARYTVNCRCRQVTYHPAVGRIGSSLDGRIGAELQRRGL